LKTNKLKLRLCLLSLRRVVCNVPHLAVSVHIIIYKLIVLNELKVGVNWVVTPCSIVVGYQRFRGPCSLHLPLYSTPLHSTPVHGGSMDLWNVGILHGVTTQGTSTWNITAVKASKLS